MMSQSVSEWIGWPGGLLAAVALLVLTLSCRDGRDSVARIAEEVPEEFGGWRATEPFSTYDVETIYEYIDGHAEVYLAYGMRRSLARRYVGPEGEADIVVDLFELASPADAFGVFTHDLDGVPVGIGEDSRFRYGWLSFWRGPWFVSISSEMESERANGVVLDLGRAIARVLPEEGEPPEIIDALPAAGLDAASVRFLRHPQILNTHVWVDDENVFALTPETAAALGTYDFEGTKAHLLIVDYVGEPRARGALESFRDRVVGDATAEDIHAVEDRGWFGVRRSGARVFAVLGADSQELARWLLGEATGVAGE